MSARLLSTLFARLLKTKQSDKRWKKQNNRTREEKKDSGISNIDADNNIDTTPTQVYDLSGRAVNKASQRGVFIFKTKKGAVKVVKK